MSLKVARTRVRFADSSKKLPVRRSAPSQPERVVPTPSTLRPAVWSKIRSRSTTVWNSTERATTTMFRRLPAYPAPTSYEVTLENGAWTSWVM